MNDSSLSWDEQVRQEAVMLPALGWLVPEVPVPTVVVESAVIA